MGEGKSRERHWMGKIILLIGKSKVVSSQSTRNNCELCTDKDTFQFR